MKLIRTLVFGLLAFFLFSPSTHAVTGPGLFINDSLKECTVAPIDGNHKDGWRQGPPRYEWQNWQKYCESLGYTFQENKVISTGLNTYGKIILKVTIIRYALFILIVGILWKTFIPKKRHYLSFIVSSAFVYIFLFFVTRLITTTY